MSEPTLNQVAIDIAEMRKDIKAAFVRIDEQKSLAESVQKLALKVELQGRDFSDAVKTLTSLAAEIKEMKDKTERDIDEIKAKPARRWESMVAQILSLIVAMLFGWLMTKIGFM